MRYSVIGTGLMGSAVARALAAAGLEPAVWNRTTAKTEPLAQLGARVHPDVHAAIDASDAVVLMLLDQSAALDVLGGTVDAFKGKAVINLMSGTPATARDLAARVTVAGGQYLDGTVQCYPSDIGSAGALINLSGDVEVWNRHRAALNAIAGRSTFVGEDPGAASILDAALAGTFYTTALAALCEALAFLRDNGVDPTRPEASLDYWLDLFRLQAEGLISALAAEEFGTSEATLSIYVAAMRQWKETMLATGQRGTIMSAALRNLEIAEAAGHGDSGFVSQVLTAAVPD